MSFNLNHSNLKYYNKLLIKLDKYFINQPNIFSNKNFINRYICNDLSLEIFTDNLNEFNIPGISSLNYLITQFWLNNFKFAYQNILYHNNNYLISNKLNLINIKFIVTKKDINQVLKFFNFTKNLSIKVDNLNTTQYLINNYYVLLVDEHNKIVNEENYEISFLKKLSIGIFEKACEISKKNNNDLGASIFKFGTKNSKKYYISNSPFSFQNSIYNIELIPKFTSDTTNVFISQLLKYYKEITNNFVNNHNYLIYEYNNVNINNIIVDYYIKKKEVYILISNIDNNLTDNFIKNTEHKNSLIIHIDIDHFFSKKSQNICITNNNIVIICLFNNNNYMTDLEKLKNNKLIYINSDDQPNIKNAKYFNTINSLINNIV